MGYSKWNYQGDGLGQEEQGIRRPIDPTPNMNHQGLGFGHPSCEALSSCVFESFSSYPPSFHSSHHIIPSSLSSLIIGI